MSTPTDKEEVDLDVVVHPPLSENDSPPTSTPLPRQGSAIIPSPPLPSERSQTDLAGSSNSLYNSSNRLLPSDVQFNNTQQDDTLASTPSYPTDGAGFAVPSSSNNISHGKQKVDYLKGIMQEYDFTDEEDDPETILVEDDESGLGNMFIGQVRAFDKWRRAFFTKKNGLKLFHKNKWALLFSIIFAGLLLALGMTAWKDKFEDPFHAWIAITIIFLTFLGLIRGVATPEILMMLNTFALLLFGVVNDKQALEGFSNSSVFCIAVLCIVASGIQHTGSLDLVVKYILRSPPSIWQAQLRLMIPTGVISAFINNIPQVAMQIPMLEAWCRKLHIPTSKMMIPLSWSTILGGTLCILGTSANLLVVSLLEAKDKTVKLPLMEIGAVGAPLMAVGIAYIVIFSKWLLPDRSNGVVDLMKVPREYSVTAVVSPVSEVVGKTIEDAGLRHLPGLYLVEIKRANGTILSAVSSDVDIQARDYLTFVGKMDSVKDLWKIPGLLPTNHLYSPLRPSNNRILTEAVINGRSDLIGKTARQCGFRDKYGAGIIAIHREGDHIRSKIGQVQFQKGDCLLLESKGGFAEKAKTTDFIILNELGSTRKKVYHRGKMIFAVLVVGLLILLNALEVFSLLTCSLGATFLLLLTRCITIKQAYEAVDVPLIVTIAGSFAMATAMEKTGVAAEISKNLVSLFSGIGDIGPLASIYICTMILTALLSNNAAVALMFPIAWNMNHLALKPRLYILMYAASADFSTPFGYATNLMVYGPGGYKFLDYTKFGLPLQLVCMVCCVPLSYWFYS